MTIYLTKFNYTAYWIKPNVVDKKIVGIMISFDYYTLYVRIKK